MANYTELIGNIDALIRAGRGDEARHALKAIELPRVPRQFRVALSELSRRAGLGELGIRLLRKFVRPEGRVIFEASAPEQAEYAACLMRVGAIRESLQLLDRLDPKRDPKIHLYRSYALISQWNYADCLAPLEAYLSETSLTPYERLVARCNLLAGLVVERRGKEARELADELKKETAAGNNHLLYGRVAESVAQLDIQNGDWKKAQEELQEASAALKGFGALDELFVRKWQAVVGLCRNPKEPGSLAALEAVAREAVTRGHWETVRSLAIQKASVTGDVKLATHIYFGTRFEAFRKRIRMDMPFEIPADDPYVWHVEQPNGPVLDLEKAAFAGEPVLKPGQVSHRLLTVLASDFYRPFRLVELYDEVYPGEYFNPATLSVRVHQAMQRLRADLKAGQIPLAIARVGQQYRLGASAPIALLVPAPGSALSGEDSQWRRLSEALPGPGFTAKTAAQLLGVSHRTANDLIRAWEQAGRISRFGKGRATHFVVKTAA